MYKVDKDRGILEQLEEINILGQTVGSNTENGLWLWFNNGFQEENFNKEIDTLFIYSDQQAGRGGLYGADSEEYKDYRYENSKGDFIDLEKLVIQHRERINKNLNVFSVQTAGYENSILPEVLERFCLLSGWTGNESSYAARMIEIWDNIKKIN